jgi:hypothetical protein
MPGDLAAAVDIDDRSAVDGAFERLGTSTGGVDRLMLEEEHGVRSLVGDDVGVDAPLEIPALLIAHRHRAETAYVDHACSVVRPR